MCTRVDSCRSEDFWNSGSRKGKTVDYFYKIYFMSKYGELRSPYFRKTAAWGEIISNRVNKELGKDDTDQPVCLNTVYYVSHGIHVIITEDELKSWIKDIEVYQKRFDDKLVVVRVRGKKEDFIGCDDHGNAVFMKVHLSRAEYRKARKQEGL